MTAEQVDALVRDLTLLIATQDPGIMPDPLDSESYIFGYRNGTRAVLSDIICRLRQIKVDGSTVVQFRGGAA